MYIHDFLNVITRSVSNVVIFSVHPLGSHQSNCTCTCADVKKISVLRLYGHSGPKQNAIGVYLHSTPLVYDFELFESEYAHNYTNWPSTI